MRKQKKSLRRFIYLILFLIVIAGGLRTYWNYLLSPVDPAGSSQLFAIDPGESSTKISKDLELKGFIHSSNAFNILVKRTGLTGKIQAGNFKLSSSMSAREILDTLIAGGIIDRSVTLLEGWRVEEMANKLNQELGIKKQDFLKVAKEGYLFPDTYSLNPDSSASGVVQLLRRNFDTKYSLQLQNRIKKIGLTPDQGVILASIVEREARTDSVRQKVASILLKRYKIDMGLNADATIQYILGYQPSEKSWWKKNLSLDDLKVISPYNTYLHVGLPPTPICSPSLSSLEAVAAADSLTPYLYYYHDSSGNSYYGRTLDEHNANIANHR